MSLQQLAELLSGRTSGSSLASAETHLSSCTSCQETLVNMAGGMDLATKDKTLVLPSGTLLNIDPLTPGKPVDTQNASKETETMRTPGLTGKLTSSQLENSLGRFGDYEILRLLGRGGMGVVYEAIAPYCADPVALKVLQPHVAQHKEARARFLRESRNLAIVEHPNVVKVLAVEEIQRLPCIVMEKATGCTLGHAVESSGPLSTTELVHLAIHVAQALQAAHDQGVIHRDIKPANIMLNRASGEARLTDFGLAKTMEDVGLTASGTVAGTPEFMSPEQISGTGVDHRSDLFSLGTLLYYAASGISPFHAANVVGIFRKVKTLDPPPITGLAPMLAEPIRRMMAKEPVDRLPNATAFIRELQRQA